jgi:uncharacterized repeat protein (TIGR03803 family)
LLPALLTLWQLLAHGKAFGGTLTTLYTFSNAGNYGADNFPSRLLRRNDGSYYGTTQTGGPNGAGTIFKITTNGIISTLYSFASPDKPSGGLTLGLDGNLYGATVAGGDNTSGSVFRFSPNGVFTNLHSFSGSDGSEPVNGLMLGTDGNFYGVTYLGGDQNYGTIFQITPTGLLTTLHSFSGAEDGAWPQCRLVQGREGNIYGTTSGNANGDFGSVFAFRAGMLNTMYVFSALGSTYGPVAGLTFGADGNLYGTTDGGSVSSGTIFRISTNGAIFSTLHTFNGADGEAPQAELVLGVDGNLYGATVSGGAEDAGTVFKLSKNGTFQSLASFHGDLVEGATPSDALVQGPDGVLYGTTASGGVVYINGTVESPSGTVFKITTNGVLQTLYSFNGTSGCAGGLVQASDGNLYGTTIGGGANSDGTVFKMTPAGLFTTLVSLSATNGANPVARLTQGPDGNLYGTTTGGGAYFGGTVFKATPQGTFTTLGSFNRTNGFAPTAALTLSTDGSFYSTTAYGGTSSFGADDGTVFKLPVGGGLLPLVPFNFLDGAQPLAGLTDGHDGNYYGTTLNGGTEGLGTVFRLSSAGVLTTLISFNQINGSYPVAGLVVAKDGNLYGTTLQGGTNDQGTVFSISTNAVFTNLYSFTGGDDGGNPVSALAIGPDNNLYGTTFNGGGTNGFGTIFCLKPNGVLTSVYTFTGGSDGANPVAGLVLGQDGSFYGATTYGTANGNGTLFRFTDSSTPTSSTPVFRSVAKTGQALTLTWSATAGLRYQVQYVTDLGSTSWTNLATPITATDATASASDVVGSVRQRFYRVVLLP